MYRWHYLKEASLHFCACRRLFLVMLFALAFVNTVLGCVFIGTTCFLSTSEGEEIPLKGFRH